MEIQYLAVDEGLRFRDIRLRVLADAPVAFGSAYTEVAAQPPERWAQQLHETAPFVAVYQGQDAGLAGVACDGYA